MNTLGLGRQVETLGLGVPYGGAVAVAIRAICRFTVQITRRVQRVITY